ncbi:MAG: ATP-dependent Clp protease ATP-binding subunit, partial [Spirochaetia bacterium]|nr:ATP-dependent Clp protease ATP-binding subunit [Spirochaetia bacterium]
MFKGFTQRAQRILTILVQDEAKRFHSDQLLPEHIMLALLREASGLGYKVLQKAMMDPVRLQMEIENSIPRKKGGFILGEVPASARGKKILEDAAEEARNLGHGYIGTEHILLACSREEGAVLSRFLGAFNVTVEMLRDIVMELSGNSFHQQGRTSVFEGAPPRRKPAGSGVSGMKKTPTLDEFSRDLTQMAVERKLDPVVGREKEIR